MELTQPDHETGTTMNEDQDHDHEYRNPLISDSDDSNEAAFASGDDGFTLEGDKFSDQFEDDMLAGYSDPGDCDLQIESGSGSFASEGNPVLNDDFGDESDNKEPPEHSIGNSDYGMTEGFSDSYGDME
jgi:hypothetical protein